MHIFIFKAVIIYSLINFALTIVTSNSIHSRVLDFTKSLGNLFVLSFINEDMYRDQVRFLLL